jgi:hypothetical protein
LGNSVNVFFPLDYPTVESLAGEVWRGGVASFFAESSG